MNDPDRPNINRPCCRDGSSLERHSVSRAWEQQRQGRRAWEMGDGKWETGNGKMEDRTDGVLYYTEYSVLRTVLPYAL